MDKEKEVNSNQESSNKSQAVVEWLLGESIPNTYQIILKINELFKHMLSRKGETNSKVSRELWQYRLKSHQWRDTELERFLDKNYLT